MAGPRKVIAIVVPHPDDLEILVGHTALYFINKGYQIVEILMSWGEYGIVNRFKHSGERLKGKPLRKIRQQENARAKSVYGHFEDGTPRVETIPLNYIDGHVPTSQRSIGRLAQTFEHLQPVVIIGPDPVYSIDWHVDHMACAYNVYFAVKKLNNPAYLKGYYLFQSFRPNLFLPIGDKNWALLYKAHLAHRSQMTPFTIKILLFLHRNLLKFYHKERTRLRKINLQEISQTSQTSQTNMMGPFSALTDWMVFALLNKNQPDATLYLPPPDRLGLVIDPES